MSTGAKNRDERVCPVCGKCFMPKSRQQITCGRTCGTKLAATKRKPKKDFGCRPCKICGKQMRMTTAVSCYCSEECRKEGMRAIGRENYRKKIAKQMNGEFVGIEFCKWCGRKFVASAYGQEYCSKMCAKWGDQQGCDETAGEWVTIRITARLDVYAEFQPDYRQTYWAKKMLGVGDKANYLIPEIGKYGLLVRETECREVAE